MTRAYTIVVTGGRTGLGRTQVAANLAIALQQQERSTVLVDLDIGQDNLRSALGISPPRSLAEALSGRARLEDLLAEGPGGIAILRGGAELEQVAALTSAQTRNLLGELVRLESRFDFIVMDAGIGSSLSALAFVRSAHEALTLTAPDADDMTAAYTVLKMVSRRSPGTAISLCVNFAASEDDAVAAQRLVSVARSFLHAELRVAGVIREDAAVRLAERAERPVLLTYPTCMFARDIVKLSSFWTRERAAEPALGLAERLAVELSPSLSAVG